jgi:hypothetical protein
MARIRLLLVALSVVVATQVGAQGTPSPILATPTGACAHLAGYLGSIERVATDLSQTDGPNNAFPGDWGEIIAHPERFQSKPLIAASHQFEAYANALDQVAAPDVAVDFQSTRVDLMRAYSNKALAVAQRGVYAATIWNSTIASETRRALAAEASVIAECPGFGERFDSVDYFGLIGTQNNGTPVASPVY